MTINQRILVLQRKLNRMLDMQTPYSELLIVSQQLDKYITIEQRARFEDYKNADEEEVV